jgi:hypothetical protein
MPDSSRAEQQPAAPGPLPAGAAEPGPAAAAPAPAARTRGEITVEPKDITEVVNGKRYRTTAASLLASDNQWDGRSNERLGRNTFLFRTGKGNYFMLLQSTWPREKDVLSPLARDEALRVYEELPVKAAEIEEAFPGIEIEDA